MDIYQLAATMLQKHALCDHCLGRQFALLGRGIENNRRGQSLKLCLTLQASASVHAEEAEGIKALKILASNGFSPEAAAMLKHLKRRLPKIEAQCFLCGGRFSAVEGLVDEALQAVADYDFSSFLVGIELPVDVAEREDEFKAEFNVNYGESIKHEFGRLIGKGIEARSGRPAEYREPDIMIIVNPFTEQVRLQVNPLFVAGRYRKLARDLPQSKWFCSSCRGKASAQSSRTRKLYPESVEELDSAPLLAAAEGEKTFFHASGREDIDARMLGTGRPFVVEVTKPKRRQIDLVQVRREINSAAKDKVELSKLRFTSRAVVRRLKKAEGAQKEYRALVQFDEEPLHSDLQLLEEKLSGVMVKQQTPLRVLHRRADLTRERYIYKLKVKKLSPKEALMEIRCQGGLYVKELVSSDEGRTQPSVSQLLGKQAKILKLDVLKVITDNNR